MKLIEEFKYALWEDTDATWDEVENKCEKIANRTLSNLREKTKTMKSLYETIDILRKDQGHKLWGKKFNKFDKDDWAEIERIEKSDPVQYCKKGKTKEVMKISTGEKFKNITQCAAANGMHRNTLFAMLSRGYECDFRLV